MKRLLGFCFAVSSTLASLSADAVGTRTFILATGDDLQGGDLAGVAIDSAGRVRAGLNLGATPVTDATAIWAALPRPDGSVLLATGNEGKLLSVKGATVTLVAETKALVVTSLTQAWGDTVVLGTIPEGQVMKLDAGKVSVLAKLPGAEHVWQVAWDAKTKTILAATGPEGKLFRVSQDGRAEVLFDADENQLMSVTAAPDGTVYTGASDQAKLYRVEGPGRSTVVHDFGMTEVRRIAIGPKGEVYAIANEISAGGYFPPQNMFGGQGAASPQPPAPKMTGRGVLTRFDTDGSPDQLLENASDFFVALDVGDDGRPYVGTGAEGRVYSVDDAHGSILVADVEERVIGALVMSGKQQLIAAGDPAVLHPVKGVGGADAVWTSKVLDAGLRARFGRMSWTADGVLELSTRTGTTKTPDDTWSAWSKPMAAPGVVESPPGKFFQVRARWSRDPKAVLHEVTVPFLTDNLRAVLTKVEASGKASGASSIQASGGPITATASTKVDLRWTVDNPDQDSLRYRVEYRLVGTTSWFDLPKPGEKVTSESYSWETKDLPEGEYRVRVTASDEPSNPPDRVRKHTLESMKIRVDNTAPTVANLAAQGRRVKGIATDGVGPITRIEVALAGTDDFVPFNPTDGIFDEQKEEFDVDVSAVSATGAAMLVVRVYDSANNSAVRNVSLK